MPAWVVPAAFALGEAIRSAISAHKQNQYNRGLAKFQADANEKYLQQQLDYNTPKSQMSRFQDAGLNPHLIYGQGNPGNQSAPLQSPNINPTDFQSMFATMAPTFNQTLMTQSQVQAVNAKTRHTYQLTALSKLQEQVLAKNPLLNDVGFKAIIDGLKSTAEMKAEQSTQAAYQTFFQQAKGGLDIAKISKELELLEQRFNLGTQDQAIKAQVLKSKEFQNAILEVQKKFMTDSDVTPQHVLQFIQLLLMKVL